MSPVELPRVNGSPSSDEDFRRFGRFAPNSDSWPASASDAAYHGVAGDIVRTIEPHSEADPHALLVSLLVAAGNALGRGPHTYAEGDVHNTNAYAVIVGESSKARKGTSFGRVREVLTMGAPDWRERICGGLSSGEGLIWQVRDPILARKRARSKDDKERADDDGYVIEIEDDGISDKRLFVVESEFAQVLRAMRRDANTLSPVLRNLWDRGDVASMTKNSPARTTGAHFSMLAHIVSDELRRELSETDSFNGFANRILWCSSRRSKILPDGGTLTPDQLRPFANQLASAVTFSHTHRELRRDDQARDLWHAVYPELSEGKPGLLGAVTSRAEAQVLRLSLIYAALDRSEAVHVEHLQAALAVWGYCERSAAHIFGERLGDSVADTIRGALQAAGAEGLSRTELRDRLGRHEKAGRIEDALELLHRCNLIERETVTTGGRPQERVRLHEREQSDQSDESPRESA